MSMPTYEFDQQQNRVIADLAKKMTGVGVFLVLAGGATTLAAAIGSRTEQSGALLVLFLAGLFFASTGVLTFRSGRSFQRVVDSEGNDIEHTMTALAQLDRFYTINFWLVFVCVILLIASVARAPTAG